MREGGRRGVLLSCEKPERECKETKGWDKSNTSEKVLV